MLDRVNENEVKGRKKDEIALSMIIAEAFGEKSYHPDEWDKYRITQEDRSRIVRDMYTPKPELRIGR